MRYLLAFPFLFLAVLSFAQENQQPFKKANTIIIETDDSKTEAMQNLIELLMEKGYSIKQSDLDLGLLSTNFLEVRGGLVTVSYSCFVREKDNQTTITITGRWFDPHSSLTSGNYPITYTKNILTMAPQAWQAMQDTFTVYPEGFVLYAKRD